MKIIIPMAGLGSRFPENIYKFSKPLIPINGTPMIVHTINSLSIAGDYIFIIIRDKYTEDLMSVLTNSFKSCEIIILNKTTQGAAETCLTAKNYISENEELIIANSDQIMWWNSELFIKSTQANSIDGMIVTFKSNSQANSFARIDVHGNVTEIVEKKVISDLALNGIHYWRTARDFFWSAETMILAQNKTFGEYYIGPSYNYLIAKGFRLAVHHLPDFQHNPVGTPEDLIAYKEKLWRLTE